MASVLLSVSGMTCDHCRTKVEEALKNANGVWSASVDLSSSSAEVDFDEKRVSASALVAAVESAGYGATIAG